MSDDDRYGCIGDVRGDCGIDHRTPEAAARCIEADHRGCAAQGGYSDRRIVRRSDGAEMVEDFYPDGMPAGYVEV